MNNDATINDSSSALEEYGLFALLLIEFGFDIWERAKTHKSVWMWRPQKRTRVNRNLWNQLARWETRAWHVAFTREFSRYQLHCCPNTLPSEWFIVITTDNCFIPWLMISRRCIFFHSLCAKKWAAYVNGVILVLLKRMDFFFSLSLSCRLHHKLIAKMTYVWHGMR